jgi:hypothetical protein
VGCAGGGEAAGGAGFFRERKSGPEGGIHGWRAMDRFLLDSELKNWTPVQLYGYTSRHMKEHGG